ncbi:hypothetical protein Tco_0213878 [Tanacetum coccineum]
MSITICQNQSLHIICLRKVEYAIAKPSSHDCHWPHLGGVASIDMVLNRYLKEDKYRKTQECCRIFRTVVWMLLLDTKARQRVATKLGSISQMTRNWPASKSGNNGKIRGIQFLGDKLVSWMSKKQDCTAMSSAKAEYVALSESCAQVMWTRTQLQLQQITIVLRLSVSHSNLMQPRATLSTEYQLADMFTKALSEDRFQYLVRRIGMRCLTPAELEVLTKESA